MEMATRWQSETGQEGTMGIGMMRPAADSRRSVVFRPTETRGQGTRRAPSSRSVWALVVVLGPAFAGLCLFPSLLCLRKPAIFYDDVVRIADLHEHGPAGNLFVPINEHMQPFFQAVTALAWELADGRLVRLPVSLGIATAVPFVLNLALLAILVHRGLGSWTAALLASALFSLGSISYYETVVWYSASSFQWALAWTLAALIVVTLAGSDGRRSVFWWTMAIVSSAMAPASCAVGLLGGPAAALWWLSDRQVTRSIGSQARAVIPIIGTAAHLAVCAAFLYHDQLSAQMHQNPYYLPGLLNVYRAPIDVLLPAVVGWRNIDGLLPDAIELGLFAVGLAAIAWSARRSADPRPLVVGAFLILAGYVLIYGSRHLPGDDHWVLGVERYHLFPQLGLTLILASALASLSRRLDRRPVAGILVVSCSALLLLLVRADTLTTLSRFYRFPDQPRTLAALDRLAHVCRANGITRHQALRAFDPIRRKWFPAARPEVIGMIPETASVETMPDVRVRPTILSALDPLDIEALCGGMDATPYLRPTAREEARWPHSTAGELATTSGMTRLEDRTYRAAADGSFLEYRFRSPEPAARALRLAVDTARLHGPISFYWAGEEGRWTVMRSVRWRSVGGMAGDVLALDRLPHWDKACVTRIRIVIGEPGVVTVEAPRLVH
jgi:hypothetical protein